mmetsp:Transcript_17842/g.31211  ORF Transcript_17842/g.31211 Transcript_17842/m.31211 type:complete len:193 (+) Transcript_17842:155-733(+)
MNSNWRGSSNIINNNTTVENLPPLVFAQPVPATEEVGQGNVNVTTSSWCDAGGSASSPAGEMVVRGDGSCVFYHSQSPMSLSSSYYNDYGGNQTQQLPRDDYYNRHSHGAPGSYNPASSHESKNHCHRQYSMSSQQQQQQQQQQPQYPNNCPTYTTPSGVRLTQLSMANMDNRNMTPYVQSKPYVPRTDPYV